ncbi:transcription-repair coupling factor [Legionella pneumophila]|uniref:transcription-repair coupling factor n=1 Tax=Legionella pneumophila TaxID=446 RepID=UPI00077073AF|nr:transcription-repair coupling factor [Legionella pneumophila]HAT9728744.1 transcription-repair coupling factor [Legionella pneumophila subsp. pneumophila]CZG17566.1 Transcription-repair-coupling factor [Legionella pneumophila]HAT1980288.1 transcription-repair coupling factor [Legionella pneumophila]HAT4422608.1 transcription-repair coupling factor [Legionella pneumophila]HAU1719351.1 transcription-repair coupling factor [Legionella pneumophila]
MNTKTLLYQPTKNKQIWGQLYGSSLALALAEYCQQTPGIKLLITQDNLCASQLQDELQFFLNPNQNTQELLFFPDWETLPYDQFSPHQDIISERLYTLSRVQQITNGIIISSASTLMHRLSPPEFLNQYALMLKERQKLDLNSFRNQLQQAGYHCVNKVLEHGEYALRGSIIDVYPMGSGLPFRIELFDDEIESLREFDPETQRTIEKINQIHLLPAREFPLNEQSQLHFRRAFRESFPGNPSHCPIYEAISNSQFPSGIEYYLPLFFDKTVTFFDYLPANAKICLIEEIQENAERFWRELNERYEQRRHDVSRPILTPDNCFINPTELLTKANNYEQVRLYHKPSEKKGALNFNIAKAPQLPIDRKNIEPLRQLSEYCSDPTRRYLIVVESAGRREVLLDLLKSSHIIPRTQNSWLDFIYDESPINITTGPLIYGCELTDKQIVIIVESQLFGEQSTPQRRSTQKSVDPDLIIRDMAELRLGAPVVHLQFGVGRYQGLQYIDSNGTPSEFLVLAYAGDDKIYVPVTSLHMISRYTGVDSEHAPLHKLGSDQWQKEKKKAAEKIHDVAIELLDLYAKREAQPGHQYDFNQSEYIKFASGFPFTETPDQLQAIEQIIRDMQSPRPMDRLICGDVGFGKTEVAMRAAFVAVQNGKQVCILAPTTLLAGQHFESFRDRFAEFPVNIELLSRFRSNKESEAVLAALQSGKVDIVIGTHKLFQNNISFKNLGLLIIDEEHRFGVKQKEHIKSLRTHVDILSMTATPIPRTLNMAMAGIRDISLIATPPAKRLAIKTFWQEKNDLTIREAILREILRGGQVFYLHNNVQTIERVCQDLEALVPEAKIQSAHGQMRERQLERIMSDFYHHRFNVLVCTTIIETGIDIPTANTIIIDRADKFGLAQLHQLRGRVGRSHHQAYAYLLTPNEKLLTPDAVKRLEAIVSLEDLGAGFTLATHDLEIRGAGELLGEEQSGNMHAIGFNLFMEMLDRAVNDLKAGKTPELSAPMHQGPEIDLRISAIIPEDYIGDIHNRLIMYKRIANAKTTQQLRELQIELIDRFGLLPQPVKHLFLITELKLKAAQLGIQKISASAQQGKLDFSEKPSIDPGTLISLIQVHAKRYQMEGPQRLRFTLDSTSAEERIFEISSLLNKLSPHSQTID